MYFACDWVIRPVVGYGFLAAVEKEFNCELAVMNTLRTTEEGFTIYPFVIRVTSRVALEQFVEKLKGSFELTDWYPVSEQYFLQGQPFSNYTVDMQPSWLDGMLRRGVRNDALQEKLENQGRKNLYFACDWVIKQLQLPEFRKVYAKTQELNCSLYRLRFKKSGEGYHVQTFGIRVPSKQVLDKFTEQIGQSVGLANWSPISEEDFYWGVKFSGVYGIEEFIEASQKSALENEEHRIWLANQTPNDEA